MTDSVLANPEKNKNIKALWSYYIFAIIASVAGVVLRFMLLVRDYDFDLGLYKTDTVLPTIFRIVLFISVVCILTSIWTTKRSDLPDTLPPVGRFLTFVSSLAGFSMIATLVMRLLKNLTFQMLLEGWKSSLASGLEIAMQIFTIPTALYFIVMAVRQDPYKPSTAALGFFPVLWSAAYLMCIYFDTSTTLNNPLRILEQFSLIVVMAFLLMELRCLVGKPKPHVYIAFGMAVMVTVSAASLPTFLLVLAMKMRLTVDTVFDAAKLCIAVYAAVRVADMIRAAGRGIPVTEQVAESAREDNTDEGDKESDDSNL